MEFWLILNIHLQQYIHHFHVEYISVTPRFTNNSQAACMAYLIFLFHPPLYFHWAHVVHFLLV